eukprot:scaffold11756_cov151-Skeletonema_menzelii.AAC.10
MASLAILGGIGLLIGLILFVLKFANKSSSAGSTSSSSSGDNSKTNKKPSINRKVTLNPEADAKHILNSLKPSTTPLELLYTIATSPDNIAVASKSLEIRADMVTRKLAHLAQEAQKAADKEANATLDELLNDDDDNAWADDDEDDEAAQAAKAAKEEKKKQEAALAKATGKDAQDVTKVMLEGVDEDVLGMQWVKRNLTQLGVWPPPNFTTDTDSSTTTTMDEPTQRNLLMTMGRLNSRALNTHPELLSASPLGKIDPSYFQSTMEFRQRVLQTLDNVLRMACTLRSFKLVCTILDAIVMFKIGIMDVTSPKEREWFQTFMESKYGKEGTPRLILDETYLGVPTADPTTKEDDDVVVDKKEEEKNKLAQMIAQSRQVTTTDEKMSLEMQITRPHAEAFTKEKLIMCQRQGIPPQIGMQAYREAWFIIVRAYKLNDDGSSTRVNDVDWDGKMGGANPNHFTVMKENKHPIVEMLNEDTIALFEKELFEGGNDGTTTCDRKVVVGWPFVISNVAQKSGKVKIQLPPPDSPGKYEFSVTIKSQEFLCDVEEFKLVVDVAQGVKKGGGGGDDDEKEEEDMESKKDK